MALTSQITTSLLQVDGRMTEGGVIEIVPGARLLLDVGVEDIEPGALLDDIATAVAEAQAARDEAVDISGISTSDAVIASRIQTPGSATETALSATFVAAQGDVDLSGVKSFDGDGKLEFNGGFTPNYDTVVWIASEQRTNPTLNSQGLYIQHRVAGNLNGLVNDAGASELRLSGVSNTGMGQAAHENSLVVTGGVNDAGLLIGVLSNFHTSGTPTGDVDEVSLFRASQIPTLAAGFTIQRATGIHVDQQINGVENFSIHAADGRSVFGPIVPKDTGTSAVIARGLAGQTAPVLQVQNSTPTSVFRVNANGTGGFGGEFSGVTMYVNNNLATAGTVPFAIRGISGQTAALQQWQDSTGAVKSYISSGGELRTVAQVISIRNTGDSGTHMSMGTFGIRWNDAGLAQTTVGAAGGASALPATPSKYFKVQDSAGTTYVIPAYAAS